MVCPRQAPDRVTALALRACPSASVATHRFPRTQAMLMRGSVMAATGPSTATCVQCRRVGPPGAGDAQIEPSLAAAAQTSLVMHDTVSHRGMRRSTRVGPR
jgi:hypothetical protein